MKNPEEDILKMNENILIEPVKTFEEIECEYLGYNPLQKE